MSVPEIGQEAYSMVFKAYKVASRQVTRVASHAYAEDLYVKKFLSYLCDVEGSEVGHEGEALHGGIGGVIHTSLVFLVWAACLHHEGAAPDHPQGLCGLCLSMGVYGLKNHLLQGTVIEFHVLLVEIKR